MQEPPAALNPYAPPRVELDGAPAQWLGDEQLARASTRFVARLVDQFLFFALMMVGFALQFVFDRGAGFVFATGLLIAAPLGYWTYQSYLAASGSSIGKRLLKVRVTKLSGEPVNFVSGVVLREWLPFVLAFVPLLGAAFALLDALFVFSAARRCLHDHMAGTKVVVAT